MDNLRTATPVQIDTKIAELETDWFKHQEAANRAMDTLHYVIDDRTRRTGWATPDSQVFIRVAQLLADTRADFLRFSRHTAEDVAKALVAIHIAKGEQAILQREIDRLEAEYKRRPWSRFHMLRSTRNAHIHSSRWCQGLHRSDHSDLGWHPELSGLTAEEAIAKLGPVLCSKCYPDAPVEHRRNPADLVVNPNACPGAEKAPVADTRRYIGTAFGGYDEAQCTGCGEMKRLRADYTIGKHDRPKVKINEITAPDGVSPLKVGGDVIKTVRTAEISYTDDAAYLAACAAGYRGTGRVEEATAHAAQVLEALAAKNGTTVEAEQERLAPKVAKKAKQYRW